MSGCVVLRKRTQMRPSEGKRVSAIGSAINCNRYPQGLWPPRHQTWPGSILDPGSILVFACSLNQSYFLPPLNTHNYTFDATNRLDFSHWPTWPIDVLPFDITAASAGAMLRVFTVPWRVRTPSSRFRRFLLVERDYPHSAEIKAAPCPARFLPLISIVCSCGPFPRD